MGKKGKGVFKIPSKKLIIGLILILLILPAFYLVMKYTGIIFNDTSSVPIGFYHIIKSSSKIEQGDIIAFCLPDNIAKMGLSRGYIKHSNNCANGSEKLIKKIIAVPGDIVQVTNQKITVINLSGVNIYPTPVKLIDKDKLPVKKYIKNGIYRNIQTYWVHGYGNPQYSWDSRYYGGIPKSNITDRLKPLWTFSHNKSKHPELLPSYIPPTQS
jgi:conjugative transfer signal peptidase TraF